MLGFETQAQAAQLVPPIPQSMLSGICSEDLPARVLRPRIGLSVVVCIRSSGVDATHSHVRIVIASSDRIMGDTGASNLVNMTLDNAPTWVGGDDVQHAGPELAHEAEFGEHICNQCRTRKGSRPMKLFIGRQEI